MTLNIGKPMRGALLNFGAALAIVAIATLIGLPFRGNVAATNLTMIYIIGVVICAARLGVGPAIFASFISVLAFNFFFTHPYHSFRFYDQSYYFTFGVMLITSLLVGSMTARLSKLVESSKREERDTHALFDFAKALSGLKSDEEMKSFAQDFMSKFFDATTEIREIIEEKSQPNCLVTDIECATDYRLQILTTFNPAEGYSKNQLLLHQTFASLLEIGIKRVIADNNAKNSMIERENERTKNLLLSSISHDLRTPLTIMNGTIANLLKHRKTLPRDGVKDLTLLWQQSGRMQKFVANLLRLAAISSGGIKLNREPYLIQEIVGAAINRIEPSLEGRKIITSTSGIIPLLDLDGALIEQVVFNLLDNAIIFTEEDGEIEVQLKNSGGNISVSIADNGKGIPKGEEKSIFNKFNTNSKSRSDNTSGTGLGLTICKAIIEAHGGTIIAQNRLAPKNGAEFVFTFKAKK